MNRLGITFNHTDIIILIAIFISIIIGCLIILMLYYIKTKRIEFLEKYGKLYSMYYDLLNKYQVKDYNLVYTIVHYVDTHKKLDNFNNQDLAIYYFINNIDNLKNNYYDYLKNENNYIRFLEEFDRLINDNQEYDSYIYDTSLLKPYFFKNQESLKKYEKNEIVSMKLINHHIFKIIVEVHYITPSGRHHYQKVSEYTRNEISSFDNISKNRSGFYSEKEYQRSLMTDSLRYNVLKRDGFRCCICGASAKDGTRLEVDHIIPISKGGMTVLDNLQTLCKECNRGKSDKM